MSGCFSNTDREDRSREAELNTYLDSQQSLEDEMSNIVKISKKEAELFLSVIGCLPANWYKFDGRSTLEDLFDDEAEYNSLMKMYDRLHDLIGEKG